DAMLSSAMPAANHSLNHWGRALGREHLDHILLDKAAKAGAVLWQPWTVKTLERHSDFMTSAIVSGDTHKQILARTVIMANGSWEKGLIPSRNQHKPSDLLAFKAHFKDSNLSPDLMPLITFPG